MTSSIASVSPLPQTGLPLKPLPDSGSPPKRRLSSAADAQTIVANLWQASATRNLKNAAMQGMLDGNPPYSPTKLRAAGRAGDANFNTLEGKAILSTALIPYHDLFGGDRRYVDIRTEFGTLEQRQTWSNIISEEYDRMLKRWQNFDYQVQQMERDFVAFGKGYLMWEDQRSWRFKKIAHYRVLVPDATEVDLDSVELFVVLQNWPVAKLYGKVRNEAAARAAGWNIDETLQAITSAVPVDPAVPNDPIAAQQQIKDNDIYVSARSSTVQTATIFVREFNGKWSELMVRRDQIPGGNSNNDNQPLRFLFESRERYEHVTDILVPFFFEVLDGSWNGASGLARDIFTIMQLKDRIACAQAQAVFLRNSLVLQPRQALDKSRMNLLQVGAVTWVPEGAEVLQSTILGDIESTIAVSRELTVMTERNTGIYRPTIERTDKGNPVTLGEFQMRSSQAMALSASSVNRFYAQLDRLYQAQWRRVKAQAKGAAGSDTEASREARLFLQRCYERGVPPQACEQIEHVRAWRNIGNGSAAMRQQTLSNLMTLYPVLPADGQVNLLEDLVAVNGSQAQVDRYVRTQMQADLPTDQQAWAMLENAAMRESAPVTWTPSQNNVIHASTHLQAAAQAAASLQQGVPPIEVLAFLDAVGAHVAVHLQREQSNPTTKEEVKALTEQWQQLGKIADQLRKQAQADAEKQQQLQQQAQQLLTDQDLARMEMEGKLAISREKAQALLQLKAQRQQTDEALAAQRQGADIALADATTAADIVRQNIKTKAEVEMQRQKATAAAPKPADKE